MSLSSRVVSSMALPGSSVTRKSGDGLDFPAGLRVLVVDDDPTCLTILEKMLQTCRYEVTKTNRAEVALTLLRENRNGYDIVISDVHMPDMDGFKLLECVGLEMDLPVIMMSADHTKTVVMKGVTHGACDYLIKPVRIEALKNIWQHVVRKKKHEWKDLELSVSWDEGDRQHRQDEAVSCPTSEGGWKSSKRKAEDDESEDKDDSATLKKPRVVWSVELHQQFVAAVNQLGVEKAVPKKILELMNVPGITRENVASHLQKYRLYLRRVSGVSQQQGGLDNSFMSQDSGFAAMSSLGGLDLQGSLSATAGQLSTLTLAAYSRMPSTAKPGVSMPFVDQRNLSNFGDGQQQTQIGNAGKQVSLLHGVPTIMEPNQFVGLNQLGHSLEGMNMHTNSPSSHQTLMGMNLHTSSPNSHQTLVGMNMNGSSSSSHQTLGGMNMNPSFSSSLQTLGGMNMHASSSNGHQSNSLLTPMMPHQQSRGLVINGSQVPRVQTSMGVPLLPMQSNGSGSRILSGNAPQLVDFSVNQISELPGSSNVKGTIGYAPSYDVLFSDLQQRNTQDWQLQNPGMTFGSSSQHATLGQNSINVAPSVLLNQSYVNGKQIFSGGLENQQMGLMNPNQNLISPSLVGNSTRMKTEIRPNLFSEQYGQDDLLNLLLKQQEGVVSGEFDFDGYTLDNIPV